MATEYYNIIAEYIWPGNNFRLQSKSKVIKIPKAYKISQSQSCPQDEAINFKYPEYILQISNYPIWNFDGQSSEFECGDKYGDKDYELYLKPVRTWMTPKYFRPSIANSSSYIKSVIVLCEVFTDLECSIPHSTNNRNSATKIFADYKSIEPWFGIKQELYVSHLPHTNEVIRTGTYRKLLNNIYSIGIELGLGINGFSYDSCSRKAQFKLLGTGINAADEKFLLSYIIYLVLEEADLTPDYNINGAKSSINLSTVNTRDPIDGIVNIMAIIRNLQQNHPETIKYYGYGICDEFKWSIGGRNASIRIPASVNKAGFGHFEDRRPNGEDIDYYLATSKLLEHSYVVSSNSSSSNSNSNSNRDTASDDSDMTDVSDSPDRLILLNREHIIEPKIYNARTGILFATEKYKIIEENCVKSGGDLI
jgi:glutamine synthetase